MKKLFYFSKAKLQYIEVKNFKKKIFLYFTAAIIILAATVYGTLKFISDVTGSGKSLSNLKLENNYLQSKLQETASLYKDLDFDIPVLNEGDTLARYYVRIRELIESSKIVRQCLEKLPSGPIDTKDTANVLPKKERIYTKMEELIDDFMIINFGTIPEKGAETYFAIEASKGELGFYLISNGSGYPYRLKIHSPSFMNIQALPVMMKGCLISDVVAIIGSVDPVMGEADK